MVRTLTKKKKKADVSSDSLSSERLEIVLEFWGFPNCLDVGKGRKLPYAAQNG